MGALAYREWNGVSYGQSLSAPVYGARGPMRHCLKLHCPPTPRAARCSPERDQPEQRHPDDRHPGDRRRPSRRRPRLSLPIRAHQADRRDPASAVKGPSGSTRASTPKVISGPGPPTGTSPPPSRGSPIVSIGASSTCLASVANEDSSSMNFLRDPSGASRWNAPSRTSQQRLPAALACSSREIGKPSNNAPRRDLRAHHFYKNRLQNSITSRRPSGVSSWPTS